MDRGLVTVSTILILGILACGPGANEPTGSADAPTGPTESTGPDLGSGATLRMRLTAEADEAVRKIHIQRLIGEGVDLNCDHEPVDGFAVLGLPPGPQTVLVGPVYGENLDWIRVRLELDLKAGETAEREVVMRRGGRVWILAREEPEGSLRFGPADGELRGTDLSRCALNAWGLERDRPVAPGEYVFEWQPPGGDAVRKEVTVRAGETTNIPLE